MVGSRPEQELVRSLVSQPRTVTAAFRYSVRGGRIREDVRERSLGVVFVGDNPRDSCGGPVITTRAELAWEEPA
jgi:hypothetical protein